MLSWITRIFFALAGSTVALFLSRDLPSFGVIQTMVAIVLIVGLAALLALWPKRRSSHFDPRQPARSAIARY